MCKDMVSSSVIVWVLFDWVNETYSEKLFGCFLLQTCYWEQSMYLCVVRSVLVYCELYVCEVHHTLEQKHSEFNPHLDHVLNKLKAVYQVQAWHQLAVIHWGLNQHLGML